MSLDLVGLGILLCLGSSLLAILSPRSSRLGQLGATVLMGLAAAAALAGSGLRLASQVETRAFFPWPAAGNSLLGLDALSAFFLVPVFLVGFLGSVYGLGYYPRPAHPRSARRLETFWGLLVAGMGLLLCARHAMAFLLGWELMALSAFFLVATEDFRKEARRASIVYIMATHVSTLVLFGIFALWRKATGSFALEGLGRESLGLPTLNALFFLSLLGFGLKAGAMPLHFWLPGAHAAAPSHVSAMLSGVVLKMGIYGFLRLFLLIEDPPVAWGAILIFLGAVSGLLGVAFALGQHDLKRLLAYHSVENIGIILLGLGLAMVGRARGEGVLVVLGLGGCLLHVWNHSLFKSLLFLGAGSVHRAAHTRELDRLGGLSKAMPFTALAFLVGAVAICGLPPLNGFVSELLVYLGLLSTLDSPASGLAFGILAVPVLAAIGALALACFVKVYGIVFLGSPRTQAAQEAQESPATILLPMGILAALCAALGLFPGLAAPILDEVIRAWKPALDPSLPSLASLVPFPALAALAWALLGAILVLALAFRPRRATRREVGTWDCGYAAPGPRMQYTASSIAATLVGFFAWALRPRRRARPVTGPFPGPSLLKTAVDDTVLDGLLAPALGGLEALLARLRSLQQGLSQVYILLVLITLVVLLSTLLPLGDMVARLFAR